MPKAAIFAFGVQNCCPPALCAGADGLAGIPPPQHLHCFSTHSGISCRWETNALVRGGSVNEGRYGLKTMADYEIMRSFDDEVGF